MYLLWFLVCVIVGFLYVNMYISAYMYVSSVFSFMLLFICFVLF